MVTTSRKPASGCEVDLIFQRLLDRTNGFFNRHGLLLPFTNPIRHVYEWSDQNLVLTRKPTQELLVDLRLEEKTVGSRPDSVDDIGQPPTLVSCGTDLILKLVERAAVGRTAAYIHKI